MTSQPLSLDVNAVPLGEGGIPGLVWPVSLDELARVRDRFAARVSQVIKSAYADSPEDAKLLTICSSIFLAEALSCTYVCSMRQRFAELGRSLEAGKGRAGSAARQDDWSHRSWETTGLLDDLRDAPWRNWARAARGLFQTGPYRWRNPNAREIETTAVVVNASRLADRHARQETDAPIYVNQRYFFGGADRDLPADLSRGAVASDIRASLMEGLRECSRAEGFEIPDAALDDVAASLAQSTGLARYVLGFVRSRPERLPRRLWTGTGGKISHRILHTAVREQGGHSWSHDHGSGLGYFDINDANFTEFATPDTMVTYSQPLAEGYRRQQDPRFLMGPQWPEIVGIAPSGARSGSSRKTAARPAPTGRQRVLVVSNQYRGNAGRFTAIEPDLVALDWHARVLGWLQRQGHAAMFKEHPDSLVSPGQRLSELFDVKLVTEAFEQVRDDYDVTLLDYVHSSLLHTAMVSDKALVYVDFGHCPFQPEAEELFRRRVRVVRGWHDENNRCAVDWDDLRAALDDAHERIGDTSFVDTYLPFGRG